MSDNVTRAEEIVETWLSMNLTKARLVGQIVAALDHREVAIFRALKVTIRALADEQGVTVEENEYPCNMLAALVRAMAKRGETPSGGTDVKSPAAAGAPSPAASITARQVVDTILGAIPRLGGQIQGLRGQREIVFPALLVKMESPETREPVDVLVAYVEKKLRALPVVKAAREWKRAYLDPEADTHDARPALIAALDALDSAGQENAPPGAVEAPRVAQR